MTWVKVCFPGQIKVDLAQVCIRIAVIVPATVYNGEILVVQRQVAEPGHQHANEERLSPKDRMANESPPLHRMPTE